MEQLSAMPNGTQGMRSHFSDALINSSHKENNPRLNSEIQI
ncbi:MAG: hypothetical protein RM347_026200 [Nostoc sp. ChiQUE02]|nr:hypothetical protein [Nostoc sp. ChiQUE02]MDZ8230220.1 hypothetical protein [Nostoc sp. ChiQUE02]